MKLRSVSMVLACIAVLGVITPAFAHRLDEYLEATTIGISSNRIALRVRLTAGVAAAKRVLAVIDTDGDGVISSAEQNAYAARVRGDLSLAIDGRDVSLNLTSVSFPTEDEIRQGLGDIIITFEANIPSGSAERHQITFENHHQRSIAAYLVNALVPDDPRIRVLGQDRTRDQSSYRLDFAIGESAMAMSQPSIVAYDAESLTRADKVALIKTYFWHGVHHILTGFDHLLFLAALVLGATTLWELVKVVTAFTMAHSITLTLAALGLVHLPSGLVEPLIAASIVFVAVQNVFWPGQSHGCSRLLVAFSFGLFHGLGFAGGLLEIMHQMPTTMILLAIFGFSVGVEAGNQIVLLPLFAFLRLLRNLRARSVSGPPALPAVQRVASAAVSMAGVYYLCISLVGA